jgi:hypothetical protein
MDGMCRWIKEFRIAENARPKKKPIPRRSEFDPGQRPKCSAIESKRKSAMAIEYNDETMFDRERRSNRKTCPMSMAK